MRKQIVFTTIISLILLSSPLVVTYSQPLNTTLLVSMKKGDSTISIAINLILQNYPNAIVVDYHSLRYALTISRVIGPVLWIGHGNEIGIETNDGVISWKEMVEESELTINSDYFLSCYSSNIREFTTNNHILTFGDAVDVTIASNIALFALTNNFEYIDNAINCYQQIISGIKRYTPLMPIDEGPITPTPPPPPPPPPPQVGLDSFEILWWIAMFALDFIGAVILLHALVVKYDLARAISLGKDAGIVGKVVTKIQTSTIYNAFKGKVTSFATWIIDFLGKFAKEIQIYGVQFVIALKSWINFAVTGGWKLVEILGGVMATATIEEWLIFGAEFALSVIAVILTASTILWIRIGGFLLNLGLDIWGFIKDLND